MQIENEIVLYEFRFNNKIRKTCDTEENKDNSYIAGRLKSDNVDNAILFRVQCEAVCFFSVLNTYERNTCE